MVPIVDFGSGIGFARLLLGFNDEHVCGWIWHWREWLSGGTLCLRLDAEALLVHLLDLLLALEGTSSLVHLSVPWRIGLDRSLFGFNGRIP